MKAVIGSSTTVYAGAIYEQTTSGGSTTITKYYQAGGQRIALRVNGVVRWLATDHPSASVRLSSRRRLRAGLGSTAVTANETGARIAELRYKLLRQAQGKSWGESRYSSVSYTHLPAHETVLDLECRLLLEKNKQ